MVAQLELQEISGIQIGDCRQIKSLFACVSRQVESGFSRAFKGCIEVIKPGGDLYSVYWLLLAVDDRHRVVIVGILDMDCLAGFLGSEISACRDKIVVIQLS